MKVEYKEEIYLEIMKQKEEVRDDMLLSAISQSRVDCNQILKKFQIDYGD